ncbi:MAG: LysR family transcriptional regulator, partial [Proteobacteria bacterium]|nr:LysR family transcriptional regulator [Pseudomonadota bacterium]
MGAHDKKKKQGQPGWRGRVWLEGMDGTFIGYGRAMLLERIKEYGSISKAAKSMDMSYKHAWDLIKSMQNQ